MSDRPGRNHAAQDTDRQLHGPSVQLGSHLTV